MAIHLTQETSRSRVSPPLDGQLILRGLIGQASSLLAAYAKVLPVQRVPDLSQEGTWNE